MRNCQDRHGTGTAEEPQQRSGLNVTNSTSEFDDADVRLLVSVIDGNLGHTLNPVLNGVGEMRNNLHSLSKILTSSLSLNHVLVDLTGGNVVVPSKGDVDVPLVVTEIQISFTTIVENKNLTVLQRRHRSGVNVHVGINFDGCDLETLGLEQKASGRGQDTLTNAGNDT